MMIQDAPTQPQIHACSCSSSSSSSPKPSFALKLPSFLCLEKMERKTKEKGFIRLFPLASPLALVWLWCVMLEEKQGKCFYGWKENEESGFMITLLVN